MCGIISSCLLCGRCRCWRALFIGRCASFVVCCVYLSFCMDGCLLCCVLSVVCFFFVGFCVFLVVCGLGCGVFC